MEECGHLSYLRMLSLVMDATPMLKLPTVLRNHAPAGPTPLYPPPRLLFRVMDTPSWDGRQAPRRLATATSTQPAPKVYTAYGHGHYMFYCWCFNDQLIFASKFPTAGSFIEPVAMGGSGGVITSTCHVIQQYSLAFEPVLRSVFVVSG